MQVLIKVYSLNKFTGFIIFFFYIYERTDTYVYNVISPVSYKFLSPQNLSVKAPCFSYGDGLWHMYCKHGAVHTSENKLFKIMKNFKYISYPIPMRESQVLLAKPRHFIQILKITVINSFLR
jgi:hypothetical protein